MPQGGDHSRDLLAALLAMREGLADASGVFQAFDAWSADPARSATMAALLASHAGLDEQARARLDALVEAHIRPPGDDATSRLSGEPTVDLADLIPPNPAGASPPASAGSRFRVLRPHARGGLGEVFLALDPELNRRVALKELREHHAHDPASQSRFLLEAGVTGRLEHPGVVPVYGLGRHPDGRPYYATRFIEGETLRAAVRRYHEGRAEPAPARALAFRRLLRAVIDACNTLAYAHSRGIIHRDVKPENIMLGRFGETLVVDWGLARPLAPDTDSAEWPALGGPAGTGSEDAGLTRPGAALGTPSYMSPEQAAGDLDRVGPTSDVYGLGATLYCVLAGGAPFRGDGVHALIRRVLAGDLVPPSRVRKGVDPALEAVCLKAMALRPDDRYATPLDLASALEAWLADVRFQAEQEQALNQARRTLARLCIERAQNLFGRDRPDEGRLWLARALENVPPDAPGLERVVRASLTGWHGGKGLIERVVTPGGKVLALAFSPDGRCLATANDQGNVRLWDVATGSPLSPAMPHPGPVRAVAFSPDAALIATASDPGLLRLWDAHDGRPLCHPAPLEHHGTAGPLTFHPDGTLVAASGCLYHVPTCRPVRPPGPSPPRAFAFSPDGARLAAAFDDGRVRLQRLDPDSDPATAPCTPEGPAVLALAFSPDGRRLLAGCADGKARVWDATESEPPGLALSAELSHPGEVVAVCFGPTGTAAAASAEGSARLWDSATWSPLGEPLAHRARVDCLAFDPDGLHVATGSWDGCARLWDAETGLPVGPPMTHRAPVHALAFSPDGRRVATAGADGQARCRTVPSPVRGDPERVACWVRVTTGLDFDPGDAVRPLDPLAGYELRRRLQQLGGPPLKG